MKDFAIYVRTWDQANWVLSPKYEFVVNKNTTMKDLAHQIHKHLLEHSESNIIPPEEMDICRILSIHKFSIIDLVDMEVLPHSFSTSEWSARSASSENPCLSTPTDSSTSSSRPPSNPDNSPRTRKSSSAGKSRQQ
jgi:hypothetical protein